jgi:hypothetical protein
MIRDYEGRTRPTLNLTKLKIHTPTKKQRSAAHPKFNYNSRSEILNPIGLDLVRWRKIWIKQVLGDFLMAQDIGKEKKQAHELIERLPPTQLSAVVGLLEAMLDPSALSNAPLEEEEITSETAAALDRARESLARGEGIPHEEILREFGLSK